MILLFAALAMLASSCGSYKRLAYLQDMEPGIDYSMPLQPDAIIAKGDRLSINVVCSTPELAAPFCCAAFLVAALLFVDELRRDPASVTRLILRLLT